ncbi:MAG: single-stranded-DNA-specific exonuclease RecJ [Treponema sp.]|nr:single-stranded-DNA-specific exonuclease RecJ [Treponema sp.]
MSIWEKKAISVEQVKDLHNRFGIDALTASIFARRNIQSNQDILFFLESDLRFQHNPFLFENMEDVVDRIIDAKDEQEKVLIFGDRDVDGITSTALLYSALSQFGLDVQWRLPEGNDAYGLSKAAVDDFAATGGTLIITVDCGISNNEEIAYANDKCIDVIVIDHHNQPDELPNAIIIDPKVQNCGYPFPDISGCAVAYKVISALRFSKLELYKQDICLLHVVHEETIYRIEALKVHNCIIKSRFTEEIQSTRTDITQTKLFSFLEGQQILVWDAPYETQLLQELFGHNIEFNLLDIQTEIVKMIPAIAKKDLTAIKQLSKIAKYADLPTSEIEGLFNLFVTFVQKKQAQSFPLDIQSEEMDLELVMLAAISDIMPLKNENRIFVRHGLESIALGHIRPGLQELLARLNLLGKRITSTDLSWNVTPTLNAAGRLGKPSLALELLLAHTTTERDSLIQQILDLNQQRKELTTQAEFIATPIAKSSIEKYNNKLCVVIDEKINRGITGILASRLVQTYTVPAMVITIIDKTTAVGSMRSCRDFALTPFLNQFGDIFINHGGHNFAAGFSFELSRLHEFETKLSELAKNISFTSEPTEKIDIDAELPPQYLKPDLLSLIDLFEPFGEGNPQLTFMTKSLKIADVQIMGKTERQHLRLTLDCGTTKWPAVFWGAADKLHIEFEPTDLVDITYHITRNTFNGMEKPQLIITDLKKTQI